MTRVKDDVHRPVYRTRTRTQTWSPVRSNPCYAKAGVSNREGIGEPFNRNLGPPSLGYLKLLHDILHGEAGNRPSIRLPYGGLLLYGWVLLRLWLLLHRLLLLLLRLWRVRRLAGCDPGFTPSSDLLKQLETTLQREHSIGGQSLSGHGCRGAASGERGKWMWLRLGSPSGLNSLDFGHRAASQSMPQGIPLGRRDPSDHWVFMFFRVGPHHQQPGGPSGCGGSPGVDALIEYKRYKHIDA